MDELLEKWEACPMDRGLPREKGEDIAQEGTR